MECHKGFERCCLNQPRAARVRQVQDAADLHFCLMKRCPGMVAEVQLWKIVELE